MTQLEHHHLIYSAKVVSPGFGENDRTKEKFRAFLLKLIEEIDMKVLLPPVLVNKNYAWTGFVVIETSHMSFHYWIDDHVEFDIYSCKDFDPKVVIASLNQFWKAEQIKALYIRRDPDMDFQVKQITI